MRLLGPAFPWLAVSSRRSFSEDGSLGEGGPVSPACLPRYSFNVSGSRRLVAP
ncbi:MAG TPA: hypothetical protein VGQ55_10055 [Pyrinomonadaceae bacterium]|nr:hypothetical protein [Pyrinomonadaceae bacterium]